MSLNTEPMTELERLATVETEIRSVQNTLSRMEGKIDAYASTFVPRIEIEARFKNLSEEIRNRTSVKNLKSFGMILVTATITALVAFFFTHQK